MLIHSDCLGELDVDKVWTFPQGILGFSEEKKFAVVPYKPDSPFSFLQSVSEPSLTFLVVSPFDFFKDYEFEFNDQVAEELGVGQNNAPQIMNLVTLIDKPEDMTVNLLAPIIINRETRQAVQIVLEQQTYTTSHRLFPEGISWESIKEGW